MAAIPRTPSCGGLIAVAPPSGEQGIGFGSSDPEAQASLDVAGGNREGEVEGVAYQPSVSRAVIAELLLHAASR